MGKLRNIVLFDCNVAPPMPQNLSIFSFLLYHPPARHRHSGSAGTSTLSIWLSVDPMSDKYPSTSLMKNIRENPHGSNAKMLQNEFSLMEKFTRNSYIINAHGSRFAVRTAVCHAPTMTVNASLFPENGKQGLEDELEVFF